jgi:hypothetical protein
MTFYIYFFRQILLNFKYLKIHKKIMNYFYHNLVAILQWPAKFEVYMFYSLEDTKKINLKK